MNSEFIPFALPDIGEAEIKAVSAALNSGWVTTGPETARFEAAFRAYLGDDCHCIAVNSATAGLHLACEAAGIGPGDQVIAPTLTFTATVEILRYLNADPVLVDVDPKTLNMDVGRIESLISEKTKAIIPVHYGGLACDMSKIFQLANKHNLKIIEDAAHALPTTYGGKFIGTLGSDATVFSFYANKTITTGEGGMVVTRSATLADRMRTMRLHGIDRDAFERFTSKMPSWYYEVVAPGYKYNMTDIAAAMGIVQLQRLEEFHNYRNQLAERYYSQLAELPLILPQKPLRGEKHAWHLFVVRLDESAIKRGLTRDKVIKALAEKGVGTSVHYVPLHHHPYWRDLYNLSAAQFPVAEQAYRTMISIPLYTKMTFEDQSRVIDALRSICLA